MSFCSLQLFLGPFNDDENEDLMCIPRVENVSRSLALGDAAGTFKVNIFTWFQSCQMKLCPSLLIYALIKVWPLWLRYLQDSCSVLWVSYP